MMKHIIPTVLFIFSCSLAIAQVDKMNIVWGDNMKAKKMLITDVMNIGNQEELFAINSSFKAFNKKTFLERYEDLSLSKQMELTENYDLGVLVC